jgi:diguanylate cyclase (GGDEF)-like protein/PAS domain S-box-containing protein
MVALEEDKEEMYAMNEELEATLQQITAADQEVKRQKLNFEALFSNNQNAVAMVNAEHLVTNVNKAFTDLFGYGLDEIAGKNLDDIVAPSEDNNYARAYTEGLLQGQVIKTEGVRYTKDLKPIEVRIQGVPITREGYMIGGYGIYTDISEVKRQERERYFASTHDDLTGLFNRTYFNERLIEYGQLGVYPISIIIIDVNGLKMINDGFGPSAGDQLLKDIASALQSMAEDNQLVARFGGDEFAILTRHMSSDETERLAKRITGLSGAMSVFDTEISLSVGWSIRENAEDDVTTLLRVAEDDLYKHKVMESSSVKGRTVYTMINTLHESNKREEQHSRRVSSLCEQFGRVLALSDREMNALKSMSLLHDIGKVAIDDKILNKPGALTEEEYAEMKRHPEIGYRILSSVPELNEIAEYVLAHHEKWDGSGYPHGLKNEEIPFLARVITIVDAYDAMTSKRPYRDAQGEDWAIEELRMNAGSQFDPELIPIFIDVMTS